MVKISPDLTSPVAKKLAQLKSDLVFSAATGNYKEFKNAMKAHAKLAVDNFELSKSVKAPEIKALKQMAKQEKLKREAQKYMSNV